MMSETAQTENGAKKEILPLALSVAVVAAMSGILYSLGRVWWCKLGDYAIYVNEAWNSNHTSQHLFDPYTFTHILHGVAFFWIASVIFARLSVSWRFLIAMSVEAGWEVLENTNFIIEKYRENTASLDYFGDSIFNSVGDVAACAVGFCLAVNLGWWRSLIFFILTEIALLLWIRDSLLLNIMMLVYPLQSVKDWQMGVF